MKYIIDNDLHIHSKISLCSDDTEQTNERILKYAEDLGLKTICLADHFWDEAVLGASDWYKEQDYSHIAAAKPLPQSENVKFLFGCETELNKDLILGVSKEKYDLFDFIVIPNTHFHMTEFTLTPEQAKDTKSRAKAWVDRFDAVLNMDLPFKKVGLAHLTSGLMARERKDYLEILNLIPEEEMRRLFKKSAELGLGIELNMKFTDEETDIVLRPYRIARECGCKFYLGSDAHHPSNLDEAKARFERVINLLELTEDDKFRLEI